jgi:hypothetical protein
MNDNQRSKAPARLNWYWRAMIALAGSGAFAAGWAYVVPPLAVSPTDLVLVLYVPLGLLFYGLLYSMLSRRFRQGRAFPGLHWSLRALIAFVVAMIYGALLMNPSTVTDRLHDVQYAMILRILAWLGRANRPVSGWPGAMLFMIELQVHLTILIALAVYGLLTLYLRPKTIPDRETRCRKCGHILRGITEPRCPECGERI